MIDTSNLPVGAELITRDIAVFNSPDTTKQSIVTEYYYNLSSETESLSGVILGYTAKCFLNETLASESDFAGEQDAINYAQTYAQGTPDV